MAGAGGGYSVTAWFARLAGPVLWAWDRRVSGTPVLVAELSDEDRAALQARLTPAVERLLVLRDEVVAEVDEKARVPVPAAAGVALLVVWLTSGNLLLALGIAAAAAGGVFSILSLGPAMRHDADVRRTFGPDLARYLADFSHETEGFLPDEVAEGWKLFPRVDRALWLDRMQGTREGRAATMYRLSARYYREAPANADARPHRAETLEAFAVEIPAAPLAEDVVILMSRREVRPLSTGPLARGLAPVDACEGRLRRYYTVLAADPGHAARVLTPERCAQIRALAEDYLGRRPRRPPILLFLPDRLLALFPLTPRLRLFRPPPFWQPLDPDAVLDRFASDLAVVHGFLMDLLAIAPPPPPAAPPPAGQGDA